MSVYRICTKMHCITTSASRTHTSMVHTCGVHGCERKQKGQDDETGVVGVCVCVCVCVLSHVFTSHGTGLSTVSAPRCLLAANRLDSV